MPSGEQNARKTHCPQGHEYTPENTGFQTKHDRGDGRLSRYCKACDRERMQRKRKDPEYLRQGADRMARWRERNPDVNRERWQQSHAEKKQILDDARRGGCIECGEDRLPCLDFHHRDPSEKDGAIAEMRRFGKQRLLAEIAKCDVLCANCHRWHHHLERHSTE